MTEISWGHFMVYPETLNYFLTVAAGTIYIDAGDDSVILCIVYTTLMLYSTNTLFIFNEI